MLSAKDLDMNKLSSLSYECYLPVEDYIRRQEISIDYDRWDGGAETGLDHKARLPSPLGAREHRR